MHSPPPRSINRLQRYDRTVLPRDVIRRSRNPSRARRRSEFLSAVRYGLSILTPTDPRSQQSAETRFKVLLPAEKDISPGPPTAPKLAATRSAETNSICGFSALIARSLREIADECRSLDPPPRGRALPADACVYPQSRST